MDSVALFHPVLVTHAKQHLEGRSQAHIRGPRHGERRLGPQAHGFERGTGDSAQPGSAQHLPSITCSGIPARGGFLRISSHQKGADCDF